MAAALLAGLAALERDESTACRQLERAAEGFRASEMALHQDAALLQLGRRLGGDHGEVLRARAQQRLALQVRNPERVVATIAPGLLA
jgi:hypothetical protein